MIGGVIGGPVVRGRGRRVRRVLGGVAVAVALWVLGVASVAPLAAEVPAALGLGPGVALAPPPHRPVQVEGPAGSAHPVLLPVVVGLLGPVLVVRRYPAAGAACAAAAFLAATVLRLPPLAASYALPVVIALAARGVAPRRSPALAAALLAAAAAAVAHLVAHGLVAAPGTGIVPGTTSTGLIGITLLLLAGAWWIGRLVRRGDDRTALLAARAAQERRIRDLEGDAAREEERLRIARELHDTLGHHLTAVPILTAVLRRALPGPLPPAAEQALDRLTGLGAVGAAEVRRVLTVLREHPAHPVEGSEADLRALLHHAVALGHRVHADLTGMDPPPARETALALHRILQESLTNVARHARGAAVRVALDRTGDVLVLTVDDDGPGGPPRAGGPPGTGRGVTGMGERARLLGGGLTAGPRPGAGGWRVRAVLPHGGARMAP